MFQLWILAHTIGSMRLSEKILHLPPGRHGGRAAVAGDDDCARRIGEHATPLQRHAPQPATQKAAHECIAGAQDIVDIDLKSGTHDALTKAVRYFAREGHAAVRTAFAYQKRARPVSYRPQRGDRIGGSTEDMDLLLGADDKVTQRRHMLEDPGDGLMGHEPVLTPVARRQSPEDWPVVDVEDHLSARRLGCCRRVHRGPE